jgi:hypothetical protein
MWYNEHIRKVPRGMGYWRLIRRPVRHTESFTLTLENLLRELHSNMQSFRVTHFAWILLIFALSACSGVADDTGAPANNIVPSPDDVYVEENRGAVCFTEIGATLIEGRIFPAGCYSGSCTKPASQNLVVRVDDADSRMSFDYAFLIEDYSSYYDFACTEDCGAGMILFSIDELENESYEVFVGDRLIGEVQLPSESFCLEVETLD